MDSADPHAYRQLGGYRAFMSGELGRAGLEDPQRAVRRSTGLSGRFADRVRGESLFAIRYVLGHRRLLLQEDDVEHLLASFDAWED
jgi:hypothetical protein